MTGNNIEKFKEAAYADQALKEKLNKALEGCRPERQAEVLSSLAQEAGFPFTAEEYREHLMQGQELDDEELDAVSGGKHMDWLYDGCSATVEPGSWCWKDDFCCIWDTTYDHPPLSTCPKCNGFMFEDGSRDNKGIPIRMCKSCGYRKAEWGI